ncbi:MAG: acyl-CoA thioesterase [Myxococcota bacterium]
MAQPPKPMSPRDSATEMTQIVLPQHTNALGTIFGGQVMSWVDICAAVVAQRHCGRTAVTAAVDELNFLAPIHMGQVVVLLGRLNAAFGSSMEVEVVVQVEEPSTRSRTLCVEALLTFVAIDEHGRIRSVPPLLEETDDDARRNREATKRREMRLLRRRLRGGH